MLFIDFKAIPNEKIFPKILLKNGQIPPETMEKIVENTKVENCTDPAGRLCLSCYKILYPPQNGRCSLFDRMLCCPDCVSW